MILICEANYLTGLRKRKFFCFAFLLTQGRAASTGGPHSNLSLRSRCYGVNKNSPFCLPRRKCVALSFGARLLGQSLSRIIPKGFVRGPQIFFGGGKILKQKGWRVGLERFTSITLSFTPLENKVLHLSIFLTSFIIIDEKRQNVQ